MKKFIAVTVVIIIFAGATGIFLKHKKAGTISYHELKPSRGPIAVDFRETGSVSARTRLEIKPPISGRIEDVLVVEGQHVKKGQIIAWMSSTDRAALLDAARSKGAQEEKRWGDIYKPTPIIAPLNGFIIDRSKEPGQTVTTTDSIVVMADKLIVEATVDETDLRYIKLGQKVNMFLDAYPDEKIRGTVEQIAYESVIVNNVTVYTVKIRPDSVPENFRTGMTATVEVTANNKLNALLLPFEVITDNNGAKTVLLKSGDNQPETRTIETGVSNGKVVEIVSGLDDNDTVLAVVKKRQKQSQGFSLMPGPRNGKKKS